MNSAYVLPLVICAQLLKIAIIISDSVVVVVVVVVIVSGGGGDDVAGGGGGGKYRCVVGEVNTVNENESALRQCCGKAYR
ncbi:unnamed protein product [Echinostoma caproni]|uniref:Secreted protein n=1 Tax=Echinostoma caproni TaxID=27848 RepID=A0A183AJZ1_9TREM|nr:unnamed protein product [Echinostoma caproni]